MSVASTILQQLGGKRFTQMTGAKNLLDGGNYLSFKIPKNKSSANAVRITLEASDTYKVEFIKILPKARGVETTKEINGVYAGDLVEIFEQETGMYTKL